MGLHSNWQCANSVLIHLGSPLALAAPRDMHAVNARRPRVDGSTLPMAYPHTAVYVPGPRIVPRLNRTPVIDSLVPTVQPSESAPPSNHKQPTTAIVIVVLTLAGVGIIVAMIFFVVRYLMRRAAVKRRRQASWILRSGQWNMEPKRNDAYQTRTGCSDASSAFAAYPYPLSEQF